MLHSFVRLGLVLFLPFASLACAISLMAAPPRLTEHVIHISVDGCNAAMLQEFIDSGKAPNFKRLQDEGAFTMNARTDHTKTETLPNHASMFTGRPVDQPEGMPGTTHHGYSANQSPTRGQTIHNSGNPNLDYIASVFDVAHDAGLSTALFSAKEKFNLFDTSYNKNHGAAHERGRDKIDTFFTADDGAPRFSETTHKRFLADMAKNHYNYAFLHFRDVDTAGHALSWGSSGWFYALANADAYLGEVLKLVETDPELKGRTTIIVNTDHGGVGFTHIDETKPEDYTIPLFVWGAGAARGDLYAMNRGVRTDPANERVPFNEEHQPIRNGDTGNLALSLLGLGPIPGSLINAKQDLRTALPGDYNLDGNVDAGDSIVWRKLKSTNDPRADGNRDGQIDDADYELWKQNFGTSSLLPK